MAELLTSVPDADTLPTLRELRVELLRACPLTCAHCSAFAAPRHPLALPLARTLDLVSEFAALGGRRLTLTGGEPLEYAGFDEVAARAWRAGLAVRVFSSGVVWQGDVRVSIPPERLAALKRVINMLVVSLYSPDPVRHDAVTGVDGSFDLTVDTVRAALALGLRTELHFVPTRLNHRELSGLVALATALGVPRISVLRFVPQGRGAYGSDRLSLNQGEYRALRDVVGNLRSAHPGLEIALGSAHAFLGLEGCGPCTAALDQLLIEADGRVAPCSAFGDFRLPGEHDNVLLASLSDVWERSRLMRAVREAHHAAPGCTGCLAQKALATGRLNSRDPDPLALTADAARVA